MAGGFRLAGLLRLRRLQEEQAAAEAEAANAQRRAAEKRRRETAQLLAGTAMPQQGDDLVWAAAIASRAALTGMVGEAALAVEATNARAQEAGTRWSDARTRVTALDKLEERHDVATRAEAERAEQVVLDESATRRHRAGTENHDPLEAGTRTPPQETP